MAEAIAGLAANPDKMAELGGLARRRMWANYTDRTQVPRIRLELKNLVHRA